MNRPPRRAPRGIPPFIPAAINLLFRGRRTQALTCNAVEVGNIRLEGDGAWRVSLALGRTGGDTTVWLPMSADEADALARIVDHAAQDQRRLDAGLPSIHAVQGGVQ